jgi:hypothetical protein
MKIDFEHGQAAHCESGVTSNLLKKISNGKITEPLAFGIGAGLFFVYVPLIKINNGPAIAFRSMPGFIFNRTCKSLGIPVIQKKFNSKEKAEAALMESLEAGQPVGAQVGVYYLSYFPKEYRFHFNAHNLIVFGKEGDNYLISDPLQPLPATSWSACVLPKGLWRQRDNYTILPIKWKLPTTRSGVRLKAALKKMHLT